MAHNPFKLILFPLVKAFAILSIIFLSLPVKAQKKLSLIVAVGNYSASVGITSIASVNDIKYIKAALMKNGFADRDIVTLINSKATKAAILKSLDQLIIKAKPGDIVVLHFAMHGQQIRDQATVELGMDEDDGFDEALLPYDVKRAQYYPEKYHGENHLRDEELGEKLLRLRNKLEANGSLLVLLDACHSGNATRAPEFATSRGEPVPFTDPDNPLTKLVSVGKDHFFDGLSENASNMVVISGSGPHQQNFQLEILSNGKKEEVGSLSYAFYKTITELPLNSSYEDLYQKIRAYIQAYHPSQLPMVEGNTNQLVFSGKYEPKKDRINLAALAGSTAATDTAFKMDQGQMDGLEKGMPVHIYKDGLFYCEGVIKRSDNFTSYGIALKPLQTRQAYEGRAVVMAHSGFDLSLTVLFDKKDGIATQVASSIKNNLKQHPFIIFEGRPDMALSIFKEGGLEKIRLMDESERIYYERSFQGSSIPDEIAAELLSVLKQQRRSKYLRLMPDGGALANKVKVKLVSLSGGSSDEFQKDESFKLEISNLSDQKLFYAVIDLNPANEFSLIYPSKGKDAANYSIHKKSSIERVLGIPADSPTGREFIKVLVSKEPLDLNAVFEKRKARADMNSMEAVFNDLFSEEKQTTRTEISGIKAEEIGLITLSFMVK